MIKKLRSKTAMSLSELLVAIAIMALVFSAVGTGIAVAAKALRTTSLSSEGAVLCDTLVTAISDELRYATGVGTAGGSAAFNSKSFGNNVTISSTSKGRIVCDTGTDIYYLLGDKAYSNGLMADVEVTYTAGVFEVEVWAYTSDNSDFRWAEATVSVRAQNYLAP